MTMRRDSGAGAGPLPAGTEMWEAGYQSLLEGWRQAQEFWNSTARSYGAVTAAWLDQAMRPAPDDTSVESLNALRQFQEAAVSVAQAWMRLPMTMVAGEAPDDVQDAVARLTEAQSRAYQVWREALSRLGGMTGSSETAALTSPSRPALSDNRSCSAARARDRSAGREHRAAPGERSARS